MTALSIPAAAGWPTDKGLVQSVFLHDFGTFLA
jgi:hypothetical protein